MYFVHVRRGYIQSWMTQSWLQTSSWISWCVHPFIPILNLCLGLKRGQAQISGGLSWGCLGKPYVAELSMLDISVLTTIRLVRMLSVQETENLTQMGLNDHLTWKILRAKLSISVSAVLSDNGYVHSLVLHDDCQQQSGPPLTYSHVGTSLPTTFQRGSLALRWLT